MARVYIPISSHMNSHKKKLVVVETHPIQYKAPLFRGLAKDDRLDLTVLYAMIPDAMDQGKGFGVAFSWDIPLLDGYRYEVLANRAPQPTVTRWAGCDTPDIYSRLKELSPDAVLVNGWVVKTCLQALVACRRLGIPCMVRGEANLLRERAWWKHAIHRVLLSRYSAWLYIGSANRDFYRFHRCPETRLFFAPYAVDNAYFQREALIRQPGRDKIRASYGIPADAVVFLFAGKLEEKKRPLDLLKSVASLPAALRPRAHVLFAGDGPLRPAAEQLARAANVSTTFAGFMNQSKLPDAYAAADVLVLPSDAGETWGLVVNEAMASGRPAIVSRKAGCCVDLIVEGKTGYAVDVSDLNGLSCAFEAYLRDPGLSIMQGAEAIRHIQSYSFVQIADAIAAAVDEIVT